MADERVPMATIEHEYAGSEWLERHLEAVRSFEARRVARRRSPTAKRPLISETLSPLGRAVADLLGLVWRGLYHLPDHAITYADWHDDLCVRIKLHRRYVATWDGNELTMLVVAAHDMRLRVEIEASFGGALVLSFHARKHRHGGSMERMPHLEDHVAMIRRCYRVTDPISEAAPAAQTNTQPQEPGTVQLGDSKVAGDSATGSTASSGTAEDRWSRLERAMHAIPLGKVFRGGGLHDAPMYDVALTALAYARDKPGPLDEVVPRISEAAPGGEQKGDPEVSGTAGPSAPASSAPPGAAEDLAACIVRTGSADEWIASIMPPKMGVGDLASACGLDLNHPAVLAEAHRVAARFEWCRTCRGVLRGPCDCMMHQDGIDTSACEAHRGGVHVPSCTCAAKACFHSMIVGDGRGGSICHDCKTEMVLSPTGYEPRRS